MGIVYAAHDGRLKRPVALKTMVALAGDERARARFRREARVAASLTHPGLCRIYEFGEDQGELFIVMELLEGETLGERLGGGAMAVADALPIALEILAALSALHARGIVHRDLKPANVFLTPDGVKLLDFGLARREAPRRGLGDRADPQRQLPAHPATWRRNRRRAAPSTSGATSSRPARCSSSCWRDGAPSPAGPSSRSCTPPSTSSRRR